MTRRRTAPGKTGLFLLALLPACAGQPDRETGNLPEGTARPTPAETTESLVTPSPADAPEDNADRDSWTAGITRRDHQVHGSALLTGVRVADNGAFERLVLEFEGSELPSYHVEYVDRPVVQCGSGEPVEVAGDAWLLIRIQPADAHTEDGVPTITERVQRPGLPGIRELRIICDFEAMVEWVVGVASPNPYRVLELRDPTRLVVDIRR